MRAEIMVASESIYDIRDGEIEAPELYKNPIYIVEALRWSTWEAVDAFATAGEALAWAEEWFSTGMGRSYYKGRFRVVALTTMGKLNAILAKASPLDNRRPEA